MIRTPEAFSPFSAYQNLLHPEQNYFFLSRIESGGLEASQNFLDGLFAKASSSAISPNADSVDSMRHFYFESRNYERLTGTNPLGLGFPLIALPSESPRLMPLFIWNLEIDSMGPKPDTWVLKFPKGMAYHLNPELLSTLPEKEKSKWAAPFFYNRSSFEDRLKTLATLLEAQLPENPFSIQILPTIENLWEEEEVKHILPNGIIGIFPPYHESNPSTELQVEGQAETGDIHSFGLGNPNALQMEVIQLFREGKKAIATSLFPEQLNEIALNLVSNQLSGGKNCLLVSDRVGRLVQFQKSLAKYRLETLSTIIQNPVLDQPALGYLIQAGAGTLPESITTPDSFKVLITRHERLYNSLTAQFKALKGPYLENWTWQELCGQFLRSQKQSGRELLDRFLNPKDFKWTTEEYEYLGAALEKSIRLFQPIATLRHPLTAIHPAVYQNMDKEAALALATAGLSSWKSKLEKLHHDLLEMTNKYAQHLTEHYQKHFLFLRQETQHIIDLLEEFRSRFGQENWNKTLPSSLSSVFSKDKKEIRENLLEIQSLTFKLEQHRSQKGLIPAEISTSFKRVSDLHKQLEAFKLEIQEWRTRFPQLVEEEVQRFSSRHAHPSLGTRLNPLQLEQEMDLFLETINESEWLDQQLEHRMLSLPQRQKYLEKITETLDTIKINLRDFSPFYDWQKHWLSLSGTAQTLVHALVKVKPTNWITAFESWYFHQFLQLQEHEYLPLQTKPLTQYLDTAEQLESRLPHQIRQFWQVKYDRDLKNLRTKSKKLIQRFLKPDQLQPTHLNHLLRDLGPLLSSRFPILMASGEQALSCLNSRTERFDTIIIWEAFGMSPDKIQALSLLGKSVLLLRETNNLEDAVNLDRTNSMQATPWKRIEASALNWDVQEVMGAFDPNTGINDSEARVVIQLLNDIQQTPQRTFPKVGIVTMNKAQRNRIASYLLEIKQTKSTGADKVQQLERNGLGVYSIDELAGQEFDQLLVSVQLGVNEYGLDRNINWLDKPEMTHLLKRLLREKNLMIIHSLPQEFFSNYSNYATGQGSQLLCGIVSLARAIKTKQLEGISAWHHKLYPEIQYHAPFSCLEEEISKNLQQVVSADRIETFQQWNDIILPIIIRSNHPDISDLVLLPDLFCSREGFTSFFEESKNWKQFNLSELAIHPIWTLDWWRNPDLESRRLNQFVQDHFNPDNLLTFQEEE
ncbi:MAG: hypothetical protein KDC34_16045 [Saprospiraceae bacterium]|nr:hypothetical protein [Saprospiraceae bacterium]